LADALADLHVIASAMSVVCSFVASMVESA
jgi:hypothetical protein